MFNGTTLNAVGVLCLFLVDASVAGVEEALRHGPDAGPQWGLSAGEMRSCNARCRGNLVVALSCRPLSREPSPLEISARESCGVTEKSLLLASPDKS